MDWFGLSRGAAACVRRSFSAADGGRGPAHLEPHGDGVWLCPVAPHHGAGEIERRGALLKHGAGHEDLFFWGGGFVDRFILSVFRRWVALWLRSSLGEPRPSCVSALVCLALLASSLLFCARWRCGCARAVVVNKGQQKSTKVNTSHSNPFPFLAATRPIGKLRPSRPIPGRPLPARL